MTKEQKRKEFRPHHWKLYENGNYVDTLDSHAEAKRVKHWMHVEADKNCLDLTYTIERVD